MHTEGEEVHETTEEARAGSTPNIVRWVLVISTLAAIVLLSAIWIFGAWSTDDETDAATATDRIEATAEDGGSTDSIVSDEEQFEFAEPAADAADTSEPATSTGDANPPPE